jgi:hypothetical protein
LVKENVVNIGVRSGLLSRCLKKCFSSVVYRIFTLAVGSRVHRSFSKRGSAVEKKYFSVCGGAARFQISFSMAEIVLNGVNHKISTKKTIASPPPEIPKKGKKVLVL